MVRQNCKWIYWGIFLLAALMAIPVAAQLPTGTILGVAKDSSGGVLPNATITITNVDTGLKRTVSTATTAPTGCRNFLWATMRLRANMPGSKPKPNRASPLR